MDDIVVTFVAAEAGGVFGSKNHLVPNARVFMHPWIKISVWVVPIRGTILRLGTCLQRRHSWKMSQGSRSGLREKTWTRNIRTFANPHLRLLALVVVGGVDEVAALTMKVVQQLEYRLLRHCSHEASPVVTFLARDATYGLKLLRLPQYTIRSN